MILKQTLSCCPNRQTHCGSEFWWKGNQVSLLWHVIYDSPGLTVYISESGSLSDQSFHDPPLSLCTTFLCVECLFEVSLYTRNWTRCLIINYFLPLESLAIEKRYTYGRCTAQFIFTRWPHSCNQDLDQETEHYQLPRNPSCATIQASLAPTHQPQRVFTNLILKP